MGGFGAATGGGLVSHWGHGSLLIITCAPVGLSGSVELKEPIFQLQIDPPFFSLDFSEAAMQSNLTTDSSIK